MVMYSSLPTVTVGEGKSIYTIGSSAKKPEDSLSLSHVLGNVLSFIKV